MMKQLFIALFSIMLGLGLSTASSVAAQTQQKQMVAVTQFTAGQTLDFFFLNSVHTLHFIEGDVPLFVSIITPEQQKAYEKAGYQPKIIDENAGDLDQYYIKSSSRHGHINEANELQNPEYKQQGLELAYQLTPKTAILKVSKGKSLSQLPIPGLHARQLHRDLVPPKAKMSADFENMKQEQQLSTESTLPVWIMPLSLVLFMSVVIYLISLRKTRTQEQNQN